MWIGGSSEAAIARTVRFGTGWQAGRETPDEVAPVIARINAAAVAAGRAIDDDHFGAAFSFRFGQADDPVLVRLMEAFRKRTGRDPHEHYVIGDAHAIVARIAEFVDAGVSKFILRPAATGDEDVLLQTRRLVDEVLPEVATRWPKPIRAAKA
jgi:alkanesulfonate monooxygenase SsuD/methylene tetrahydromethanopterin reductase-like flavin-dependent oxidoreductase (luciferase family)